MFREDHLNTNCDRITVQKFGIYSRSMKCCQYLNFVTDSRKVGRGIINTQKRSHDEGEQSLTGMSVLYAFKRKEEEKGKGGSTFLGMQHIEPSLLLRREGVHSEMER